MSSPTTTKVTVPERRKVGLVASGKINMLAPYIILLVLLLIWAAKFPGMFFGTPGALSSINLWIPTAMTLALAATAQTLVVQSGGIDLSIGGVMSLTAAIFVTRGWTTLAECIMWFVICVAVGALCGAFNGFIVAYLKLESFVVTLATWSILSGIALLLVPIPGGDVPEWFTKSFSNKPLVLAWGVFLFIGLIVFAIWFRRIRLGISIRALGSDRAGAFLSGVPIRKTTVITFALSGALAALAGLYLAWKTGTAASDMGDPYILWSIAAVVIGGTSLAGGKGGIGGSLVGTLIVVIIAPIIFAFGFPDFLKALVIGLILIIAVVSSAALDAYARRTR
jgi:ribose transport system permease protein